MTFLVAACREARYRAIPSN